MSRSRLLAVSIARVCVALLVPLAAIPAKATGETRSPSAAWKSAGSAGNPFRESVPAQWSPVRPQPVATSATQQDDDDEAGDTELTQQTTARLSSVALREVDRAPQTPITNWQLPNAKPSVAKSAAVPSPAGDTRSQGKSAVVPASYEPRSFNAPADASRMPSPQQHSATTTPSNVGKVPWSSYSTPSANWPPRSAAGSTTPNKNSNAAARNTAVPNPSNHSANRTSSPNRGSARQRPSAGQSPYARNVDAHPPLNDRNNNRNAAADRGRTMWDTIAVAFQTDRWTEGDVQPDNLPLPGGGSTKSGADVRQGAPMREGTVLDHSSDIIGPVFNDNYGDVSYDGGPPCACGNGPGGCSCPGGCGECGPMCGEGCCGCEPGCGCGCGGEIGCCDPACGCSSSGCDINCCGKGDPAACTTIRIGVPKWQEFMLFGGVQGFKGPYDQERDSGNFGFHEGFNAGFKFPFTTLGYQLGYRAVHSQLSGDKDTDIADPHTQQFVTAGFFQRVKDGVQWGIAWDMLRDERWGAVDFHQLRGELSLVDRGCHEWGIAVNVHLNDDEQFFLNDQEQIVSIIYQASDQYLAFYRFHGHGRGGGEGRFYGGFNDDSDGIIGADVNLPVSNRWSIYSGFTYLIPEERGGFEGAQQEAWNITLGAIWHWGCRARASHNNCYRPLFNVADNGYLIVDDRPGRIIDTD